MVALNASEPTHSLRHEVAVFVSVSVILAGSEAAYTLNIVGGSSSETTAPGNRTMQGSRSLLAPRRAG